MELSPTAPWATLVGCRLPLIPLPLHSISQSPHRLPGASTHRCRGSNRGLSNYSRRGGVEIAADCEIHDGALLDTQGGRIQVGQRSAIGPYTVIYGLGGVTIGSGCSIAGQSMIVASSHRFEDPDRPIREQGSTAEGIRIGTDVWVGANCVIIDGAVLEDRCVVAAASVVRGHVPRLAVMAGAPARVLRLRGDRKPA